MATTKALVQRQLDSNTDYEITITLDDDGEENKQVRRFNLKTPFFYSVLKDYISETKVSKQIGTIDKTSTKIVYPTYNQVTTDKWTVSSMSVSMGKPNGATVKKYDPSPKNSNDKFYNKDSKFTVVLTFSHEDNKKLPTLADITSIKNVGNPFINFLLSKDGWTVDQDKRTITISKYWSEADIRLIKNTSTINTAYTWRPNNSKVYGFWDSEVWLALHELDAAKTNYKKNRFWVALSSAFIETISSKMIKKDPEGGDTTRQQTLNSTIDTSIPAFIVGNSINDYQKTKVVDYFYFFVNQSGSDKWWYFDNDLSSITPAKVNNSSDSESKITGEKGYIIIKGQNINPDYSTVSIKEVVDTVTDKTKQISKSQLQARSISANANVFAGTTSTYNIDKPPTTKYPIIAFNIRFGIVRYTSTDNGKTWKGKWMPPLTKSDKLKEASKILSRTETVGVT